MVQEYQNDAEGHGEPNINDEDDDMISDSDDDDGILDDGILDDDELGDSIDIPWWDIAEQNYTEDMVSL